MYNAIYLVLTLLLCTTVQADEKYEFTSEQQRLDFIQLNEELRCPKCQNQNIADSNALIATDMKRKVYELLQQGESKEDIVEFMKTRYGDFVHYDPPMTPLTFWLYFAPLLFILLAVSYFIYQNRTTRQSQPSVNAEQRQTSHQSHEQRTSKEYALKIQEAEQALRDLE